METLESFRRQIDVARDMQSIVRTMKTLAAVNIRQYEAAVESLGGYTKTLRLGFQILLRNVPRPGEQKSGGPGAFPENTEATAAAAGDPKAKGAIVFGSDQGMCGQFNEQITEKTRATLSRDEGTNVNWSVLTVGTRVHARLEEAGLSMTGHAELPGSLSGITPFVQQLLPQLERWQSQHHLTHMFVFYNHRLSPSTCEPRQVRLLPPDLAQLSSPQPGDAPFRTLPAFRMDRESLFRALVRQHLFVSLFRACAESLASENASRIAAMQAAEKNIDGRLNTLQTRFHQLRQTAITEEILDVINGFEALTPDSEK